MVMNKQTIKDRVEEMELMYEMSDDSKVFNTNKYLYDKIYEDIRKLDLVDLRDMINSLSEHGQAIWHRYFKIKFI